MAKDISKILMVMRKAKDRDPIIINETPFQVLIATVLSQRTKDKNTALASKRLFEKYPDAKSLSGAPINEIRKLIRPAGFYRVKAQRVKEIASTLVEKHGGAVPTSLEQLLALHGVGRKTANCVLVYAFKKPALPVDVHVHRISNRLGLVKTSAPEETELALAKIVLKRNWIELNHLMVRYGQKICLPRHPRCEKCALASECNYFKSLAGQVARKRP